MEVDNQRLPGKTARNNRGMNSKSIAIFSLLLSLKTTCLSTSLLWKLEKTKISLAEEFDAIDATNRERYQEYQKRITDLERKITNLEINQNTPI